jgi:aminoglycoside phosphotransferase (APT) family kinase protein
MSYVEGTIYRDGSQTTGLGADRAQAIAHTLIDVLADLHDVDPETIGLGGFGRPDGFLPRQLSRWHKQLDASRTREIAGIDELFDALTADVPVSGAPAIVHGDYRLDNVLVGDDDQVTAVLDWEMATLGDPLTDLGLFLVYWESLNRLPQSGLTSAVAADNGFPTGAELMERYARRRSVDLTRLPWYFAFGCFKLAVIAEGIYVRHRAGQTVGTGFDHMGDIVAPLIAQGISALGKPALGKPALGKEA